MHIGETLQICKLYSVLYPMKHQLFFMNEDNVSNVIELPEREGVTPPTRTRSSWHVRTISFAVVLAVALFAGAIAKRTWLDAAIETQASEWRSLTLTDGSQVSVGPRTQLRNRFGGQQRLVRLSQGEALFQVAKDMARPFIVDAELAVVRATGTRFGVERREQEVVVTVEEGTVLVTNGHGGTSSVALAAGDQVTVSGRWPPAIERVNTARELAWSNRRLVFESDTLSAAAAEFNRRNRVQIVVDPTLGARQVRGSFQADDPVSFAESIAIARKAVIVRQSRDVIRLQPSAAPERHSAPGTPAP